jgi:hypothetical protein
MDRENVGAWPSGEATAFEAVDGGSIPSAPANGVGSSMEEHRLVKPGDVGSNPTPRPITRRSAPRGFFGVGLHNPKAEINAGAALRACGIYGASFMAIAGSRFARCRTDTMKAYRHLPVHNVEDLHDAIPFDCVPVAVELVASARSLVTLHAPGAGLLRLRPGG